jgi:hypothetical protein
MFPLFGCVTLDLVDYLYRISTKRGSNVSAVIGGSVDVSAKDFLSIALSVHVLARLARQVGDWVAGWLGGWLLMIAVRDLPWKGK